MDQMASRNESDPRPLGELTSGRGGRTGVEERFWRKVKRTADGCWEWQACRHKAGYGSFGIRGKSRLANRVAYALANDEDPGTRAVLHTCDNRLCVRPSHLYLGDRAQNARDMVARGRAKCGHRKTPLVLSDEQVQDIRDSKLSASRLAIEYNMSTMQAWRIKNGRSRR